MILLAIVSGMFWKLIWTRQYTWLNSRDASTLLLPWFQLQASALHRWSLTFWDPYQWGGQPLIGQGQAGSAYPLNWILWAMPLHRTWLRHVYLNWYFVLIHFQAALFAYFLCRDLRCSKRACLLGGLAFGLGPFMGTSEWPSSLNAAVWAPLQLMYFFRALRGHAPRASAVACGAALGASWLSGSDQIPLLLTLTMGVLWIRFTLQGGSARLPLVAGATALGMSAFQALPTLEYWAWRPAAWTHVPLAVWHSKALGPLGFPEIVMPGAGDPLFFAGWTVLVLGLIGLWVHLERPEARICACLAAAGLLLPFGRFFLFAGALNGLGVLTKDPRDAVVLLGLGLCVLCAFGLDTLGRQPIPRVPALLTGVGALCFVVSFLLALGQPDNVRGFTPLALCGLAAWFLAALIEAVRRNAVSVRAAGVCAILLAMWEFGHVTGANWVNIEFGWPHLDRLSSVPAGRSAVAAGFNLGDWRGTPQFDGISGGTRNVVGVADLPAVQALTAMRAWIVHEADSVEGDAAVRARLGQPVADLQKRAFVRGSIPALGTCAATESVTSEPNYKFTASMGCAGLLIVNQTWYPGWTATVDGRRTALLEAYGFMDALPLPAGTHHIHLIYRPWSAWIGGFITFTTLGVVFFVPRRLRWFVESTE